MKYGDGNFATIEISNWCTQNTHTHTHTHARTHTHTHTHTHIWDKM